MKYIVRILGLILRAMAALRVRLFWRQLYNIPERREGTIFTTEGWIPERSLRKRYIRTWMRDGHTYATEYFLGDKLVRRDATASIEKGLLLTGSMQQQSQAIRRDPQDYIES